MGHLQPLSPGVVDEFIVLKYHSRYILTMAETKKSHGNKKYYHVLIDINRGELFDEYIRKQLKIKPTSWIRDKVYDFLQDNIDKEVYDIALQKDLQNWQQAVQNRLKARALNKLQAAQE